MRNSKTHTKGYECQAEALLQSPTATFVLANLTFGIPLENKKFEELTIVKKKQRFYFSVFSSVRLSSIAFARVCFIVVGRYKENGQSFVGCVEIGLKLQATSARQMNVENQAIGFVSTCRFEEGFRGFIRIDEVTRGPNSRGEGELIIQIQKI